MLFLLGCSTTTTVARVEGASIEGDIVGGSPDSIFVVPEDGREYEVPRDDISSLDYPGNVHANVGLAVAAYGALNIAVGMPECNRRHEDKTAFCAGVFFPAALGLGMIAWGVLTNQGQKSAFADTSRRSQLPRSKPLPQRRPFVAPVGP